MEQMAEYAKIYLVSTVQRCNKEFRPGRQILPNHVHFWFTAPFVKLCTILVLADHLFRLYQTCGQPGWSSTNKMGGADNSESGWG